MRTVTNAIAATTHRQPVPRLGGAIAELIAGLRRDFFEDYRPERYYMRGPGPKWQAKHAMTAMGRSS